MNAPLHICNKRHEKTRNRRKKVVVQEHPPLKASFAVLRCTATIHAYKEKETGCATGQEAREKSSRSTQEKGKRVPPTCWEKRASIGDETE